MQVAHGLALDQYIAPDSVVPGYEGRDLDIDAESREFGRNRAATFEDIDRDLEMRQEIHRRLS